MGDKCMRLQFYFFNYLESALTIQALRVGVVCEYDETQEVETGFHGFLPGQGNQPGADALTTVLFIRAQGVQKEAVFNAGGE